jgi:hypothetical protein
MNRCCSAIDAVAIEYVHELAVALRTRDLENVKSFYRRWERAMDLVPMPDDRKLEIDMHKMILELPALADLHAESLAWLAERGETWDVRGNNCTQGCDPGSCGRDAAG